MRFRSFGTRASAISHAGRLVHFGPRPLRGTAALADLRPAARSLDDVLRLRCRDLVDVFRSLPHAGRSLPAAVIPMVL